jgi:hypothetical protein
MVGLVNNELERAWKKEVVAPGRAMKIIKHLCQDNQNPGHNLSPGPSE